MARIRDHHRQLQQAKLPLNSGASNSYHKEIFNGSIYPQSHSTVNANESNLAVPHASGLSREIGITEAQRKSPSTILPSSPPENKDRIYDRSMSTMSSQTFQSTHSGSNIKDDRFEFISMYRQKYSVNPFWREVGADNVDLRTHNRRRWSHVFPTGQNNYLLNYYHGLNWKSLTQPAILPLYTDYIPSVDDIKKGNFWI